jgi:predicted nucleic acid-binding protein
MIEIELKNSYLLDACIIIGVFGREKWVTDKQEHIRKLILSGNLWINEIQIYEARYILKSKNKILPIDLDIDRFIEKWSIKIYKNTDPDYKIASSIKANGGVSPYDALMLAQMQNSKKPLSLVTVDQEFNKPKFTDEFDIIFL